MRRDRPVPRSFPRIPIQRRIYAFLLDFFVIWLVASIAGPWFFQLLVFIAAWYGDRVVAVSRFGGQSLGRWAFDMKLIEVRGRRVPDLATLAKREGAIGVAAFLAFIGINYGLPNPLSFLILITPLGVDLVVAIADEQGQKSLHDRFVDTIVIPTKRGFSLDLRLRRWFDNIRDRVQK